MRLYLVVINKREEGQSYVRASQFVPELCENEVVNLLKEIQQKLPTYNFDYENVFSAEQNAFVAVNAEKYYRAMIKKAARIAGMFVTGTWPIRLNGY